MAGIEILVTCTYRSPVDQDKLYAQGRTAPGRIVTNARAWQSLHQYGVAFDVVPMREGKPVWGTTGADGELWQRVGIAGEASGLEWAGRWKRFREFPHFQYTGGLTIAELKAGKVPA
jgi:peptidoglycan L-alanyl-D-glutamate endopeptidase CwlK